MTQGVGDAVFIYVSRYKFSECLHFILAVAHDDAVTAFPDHFQIVFAVAVGFLFTMVYYKCGNLWPLIISHSLIDMFSVFASDSVTADRLHIIAIIVISIAYCIYLRNIPTPDCMLVPAEGQAEEQ